MAQVANAPAALGGQPIATISVERARPAVAGGRGARVLGEPGQSAAPRPVPQVRDTSVPASAGPPPARVFGPARGAAPAPPIVHRHGGRVIAAPDTHDASARAPQAETGGSWCRSPPAGARVRVPGGTRGRGRRLSLGGAERAEPRRRPSRWVAVAGESADGGLAINTAIAARVAGLPMPRHMKMIYPGAGTDTATPSDSESTATAPLSRAGLPWFVDEATRSQADLQDPRLDVVGKARPHGLPRQPSPAPSSIRSARRAKCWPEGYVRPARRWAPQP